jgi:hypothetical protein
MSAASEYKCFSSAYAFRTATIVLFDTPTCLLEISTPTLLQIPTHTLLEISTPTLLEIPTHTAPMLQTQLSAPASSASRSCNPLLPYQLPLPTSAAVYMSQTGCRITSRVSGFIRNTRLLIGAVVGKHCTNIKHGIEFD